METLGDKIMKGCPVKDAVQIIEKLQSKLKELAQSDNLDEKRQAVKLESVSACTLLQIRFLYSQIIEI